MSFSLHAGPLWLLSYKQQCLAYSNMCYLLWSHVEYSIVFFYFIRVFSIHVKDANVTMYSGDTSLYKAIKTVGELKNQLVSAFKKIVGRLKVLIYRASRLLRLNLC